jgi:peptide-methionine (S)-S-oxide reductase
VERDVAQRGAEDTQPAGDGGASTRAVQQAETATFGAGCFWGVEAEFRQVPGVISTAVGYAGGSTKDPSYQDVCTGTTGHAEVVQVQFDPGRVSYEQLLERFWELHDPTTLNRQGPDVGHQYRSAIFTYSPEQESRAIASRQRAQSRFKKEIVTKIAPAGDFWRAEEYHQRYLEKRGLATCAI